MIRLFHRQFIAIVAAASIVITGFGAAPAHAGDDEVAAAVAALLGLAIVGAVIKDKRDDRKDREARRRQTTKKAHTPRHQVHPGPRHITRHVAPKPLPRRVNRQLLPQQCLFNLPGDNGRHIQVFGQRCLSRHYGHVRSLPDHCGRRVWTSRGAGYGYGARCLNKQGYRLARR